CRLALPKCIFEPAGLLLLPKLKFRVFFQLFPYNPGSPGYHAPGFLFFFLIVFLPLYTLGCTGEKGFLDGHTHHLVRNIIGLLLIPVVIRVIGSANGWFGLNNRLKESRSAVCWGIVYCIAFVFL